MNLFGLFWILLWLTCAAGWVMNIVSIVAASGGDMTTLLILRIVGIFAFPLGGVLGFVS